MVLRKDNLLLDNYLETLYFNVIVWKYKYISILKYSQTVLISSRAAYDYSWLW